MKNKLLLWLIIVVLFACEVNMMPSDEKDNLLKTDRDFARTSLETNAAE